MELDPMSCSTVLAISVMDEVVYALLVIVIPNTDLLHFLFGFAGLALMPCILPPTRRDWWHIQRTGESLKLLVLAVQFVYLGLDSPSVGLFHGFVLLVMLKLCHSWYLWRQRGPSLQKIVQAVLFAWHHCAHGGMATPQGVLIPFGMVVTLAPSMAYQLHFLPNAKYDSPLTAEQGWAGFTAYMCIAMAYMLLPVSRKFVLAAGSLSGAIFMIAFDGSTTTPFLCAAPIHVPYIHNFFVIFTALILPPALAIVNFACEQKQKLFIM